MITLKSGDTYLQSQDYAGMSADQQSAADIVMDDVLARAGGMFFLTGAAGTGKGHVIGYLSRHVPEIRITAFTGIAAQLIGGVTFASAIGWRPETQGPNPHAMGRNFNTAKLLVIDEVSMLDAVLFQKFCDVYYKLTSKYTVLCVGDFLQLTPVTSREEPRFPCFKSAAWQDVQRLAALRTQHRQTDLEFIAALNDMRLGRTTQRVLDLIAERSCLEIPKDLPVISPVNREVDDINRERLAELPGMSMVFNATIKFNREYKTEKDLEEATERVFAGKSRMARRLEIKAGARVMCLTNNAKEWFNGSMGTIEQLPDYDDRPLLVRLDSGRTVGMAPAKEEIRNIRREIEAVVTQYPIKVGYAATVHKSQGQTLDRAVIDLKNAHFACGQKYVAMSRVRSKEGLYLKGNDTEFIVDEECLRESGEMVDNAPEASTPPPPAPGEDYDNDIF